MIRKNITLQDRIGRNRNMDLTKLAAYEVIEQRKLDEIRRCTFEA